MHEAQIVPDAAFLIQPDLTPRQYLWIFVDGVAREGAALHGVCPALMHGRACPALMQGRVCPALMQKPARSHTARMPEPKCP